MILVSYDGSADAQAAIDRAALIAPGAEATILTVWEPFAGSAALSGGEGMGMGLAGVYVDDREIDAANEERARRHAAEGAERATAAGLKARPLAVCARRGIAHAILAEAADADAELVVLGTRGVTGIRSFFLGSVSHAVLQHADRPVLVVPSADISEHRRAWIARGRAVPEAPADSEARADSEAPAAP